MSWPWPFAAGAAGHGPRVAHGIAALGRAKGARCGGSHRIRLRRLHRGFQLLINIYFVGHELAHCTWKAVFRSQVFWIRDCLGDLGSWSFSSSGHRFCCATCDLQPRRFAPSVCGCWPKHYVLRLPPLYRLHGSRAIWIWASLSIKDTTLDMLPMYQTPEQVARAKPSKVHIVRSRTQGLSK